MVCSIYLDQNAGSHFLDSPGRWLAAAELKAMLAHVLLSYDVKFEQEGMRPPNEWLMNGCMPNRAAKVLFRKRSV